MVVGHLAQEVPDDLRGSVFDVVCERLGPKGAHLAAYRRLCDRSETGPLGAKGKQKELLALQQTIDAEEGWPLQQRVARVLSQMKLPEEGAVETFSAGRKRQVLLAAALAKEPDLLLLDEPTNHLDLPAIDRLEAFLHKWNGTLMLITHDRLLIRRLATRIVEVDRGSIYSWNCDYATYCQRSQARLSVEAEQRARFDKRLAAEEAWIRQGIKARRTRNEGRVRKLEALRQNDEAARVS